MVSAMSPMANGEARRCRHLPSRNTNDDDGEEKDVGLCQSMRLVSHTNMTSVINGESNVANGEWRGEALLPSAFVAMRPAKGNNGDEALASPCDEAEPRRHSLSFAIQNTGLTFHKCHYSLEKFRFLRIPCHIVFRVSSRGSIGNSLSTSVEVEVWTAYILHSPDLTMWEYTGFVVVVVSLLPLRLERRLCLRQLRRLGEWLRQWQLALALPCDQAEPRHPLLPFAIQNTGLPFHKCHYSSGKVRNINDDDDEEKEVGLSQSMCLVSQLNTTNEVNIGHDRNINEEEEEEEEKKVGLSQSTCFVSHPNTTNEVNIRHDINRNDNDEEEKEMGSSINLNHIKIVYKCTPVVTTELRTRLY
ncbi:hypothetical protein FXO37_07197 [Capsicum annuum]|nr:hypothetical protein FXO37_07197 [Capsicum annuum]